MKCGVLTIFSMFMLFVHTFCTRSSRELTAFLAVALFGI